MKFKESKSIYLQIADRICDEILQGQYPEEERIPSVREYAGTVEVNANTVVRTYDYLQGLEIIYNKRGIGYFVSTGAKERIITLRKDTFLHEDLPEFFRQLKTLEISMDEIDKMYKKLFGTTIVTQTHFSVGYQNSDGLSNPSTVGAGFACPNTQTSYFGGEQSRPY